MVIITWIEISEFAQFHYLIIHKYQHAKFLLSYQSAMQMLCNTHDYVKKNYHYTNCKGMNPSDGDITIRYQINRFILYPMYLIYSSIDILDPVLHGIFSRDFSVTTWLLSARYFINTKNYL